MRQDVGSIFPLDYTKYSDNEISFPSVSGANDIVYYYSLCREAVYDVARHVGFGNKIVMIPAYTCETVVIPFKEMGWKCLYYPIDKRLRMDVEKTFDLFEKNKPDVFVSHPYYGMDLNESEISLLVKIKKLNCKVLVDITQCIFSTAYDGIADYITGSYRKWFPIPDGAFLKVADDSSFIPSYERENEEFVSLQKDAMYLRKSYFESGNEVLKSISIRLYKLAVSNTAYNIKAHKMSNLSLGIYSREDIGSNIRKRNENYRYLYDNLQDCSVLNFVCKSISDVTVAPLYFPVYTFDRDYLQKILASRHVYAPVLWPVYDFEMIMNNNLKEIYSEILMIPIDQRYGIEDMKMIVDVIKEICHE